MWTDPPISSRLSLRRVLTGHQNGLVSPLEKLTVKEMVSIETPSIDSVIMTHGAGKACIRGLNQEMLMIGHQAIGPPSDFTCPLPRLPLFMT